MLTVFWDMQDPITLSFIEKGSFVNSANYCELLKQVKKDIKINAGLSVEWSYLAT